MVKWKYLQNLYEKRSFHYQKEVRRHFDEDTETWFFSVVDVVDVLTNSTNPNNYWKVMKHRLNKEGSELVTKCNRLKMLSSDGKKYATDCLSTKNILRLIQSFNLHYKKKL